MTTIAIDSESFYDKKAGYDIKNLGTSGYCRDSLRRDVDSLEHSLREARAETVWLRDELSGCQDRIARLEEDSTRVL